jgi:peptide-methionine (S)-S-oxide reductase
MNGHVSLLALFALFPFLLAACSHRTEHGRTDAHLEHSMPDTSKPPAEGLQLATFGAGCFWCVEAVLEQLDGVESVDSGYMGGDVPDPTYEQVCSGRTGHAEVVQVTFDPERIPYEHLLEWFWKLHDPTTLNRQGGDVGTQYRSVIFYHSEEQRRAAEASMAAQEKAGNFADPIVTEISEAGPYYSGEQYHQDYYRQNKSQGYCRFVIAPKLDKLGLEK